MIITTIIMRFVETQKREEYHPFHGVVVTMRMRMAGSVPQRMIRIVQVKQNPQLIFPNRITTIAIVVRTIRAW